MHSSLENLVIETCPNKSDDKFIKNHISLRFKQKCEAFLERWSYVDRKLSQRANWYILNTSKFYSNWIECICIWYVFMVFYVFIPCIIDFFIFLWKVYFLDVPLVLWYLTFYSNERLHLAVIGKVLFLAIENCSGYWAAFMETYIYDEKPAEVTLEETKSEVMSSKFEYHPSKLWLVCLYHIVYVLISPLIGKFPI